MLAITAKVKLLKEEVTEAQTLCQDIVTKLAALKRQSDYRKELGVFAVQAPKWEILTDEKNRIINIIRKVCTGEVDPLNASITLDVMRIEFEELNAWLKIPEPLKAPEK